MPVLAAGPTPLDLVAGALAIIMYKKRSIQGKRDLVYNAKAMPKFDELALTAENPVNGQNHEYRNSMDLAHYTAGMSNGAATL